MLCNTCLLSKPQMVTARHRTEQEDMVLEGRGNTYCANDWFANKSGDLAFTNVSEFLVQLPFFLAHERFNGSVVALKIVET